MNDRFLIPEQIGRRVRLSTDIAEAARAITPFWPLESFIAVNPLDGLRGEGYIGAGELVERAYGVRGHLSERAYAAHFESGRIAMEDLEAAIIETLGDDADVAGAAGELFSAAFAPAPPEPYRTAVERHDLARGESLTDAVDNLLGKWCAAFFDRGEATWPMPGRERGFYSAWRDLARHGREGAQLGIAPRRLRSAVAASLEDPADAAIALLDELGVPQHERVDYIRRTLCRRPGWPSAIKHSMREPGGSAPTVDLTQYLAVALFYESAVCDQAESAGEELAPRKAAAASAANTRTLSVSDRVKIWQAAFERGPGDRILAWTMGSSIREAAGRPAAQAVFCIDVRSESLRRHLEAAGPYETVGFAGFFGMPVRWRNVAGGAAVDLCPALLTPRHAVDERFRPGTERAGARAVERRARGSAAKDAFHAVKDDTTSKFALAEAAGWFAGPAALLRTLRPELAGRRSAADDNRLQTEPWLDESPAHDPGTGPAPEAVEISDAEGLSLEEQSAWAETALRMMGLTSGFAPLVLLCGHGSTSVNNAHSSALDCGACGGSRGGQNARVACALLNRRNVREALAEHGIEIPADTWFVAGEHDTSLDAVQILDRDQIPASHAAALASLEDALKQACRARAEERARRLPGAEQEAEDPARLARLRASDWAQVRPEWGLAGNSAFVIGPRSMTAEVDLAESAFLHSYDADGDPDGAQLEAILTAPMVVAHWINMQYHYSAVAPEPFSAGSKVLHNVVARMGVVQGPSGDLRIGLPLQSVAVGDRLFHEPLRLLTLVEAPVDRIESVIARNTILRELFDGGWVRLAAREPGEFGWSVYRPGGSWVEWQPAKLATRQETISDETEVAR